ncbi:MFS-type transporter [Streptomyces fradiae]|uniref:MFS transporter n=3 Tax=Streptomyces TaxID=1883 RepID=A0A3M8F9T4_9ACTN|nr:MFS-type transporter [Streptomyces fradiae]OFA49759.1 MFS-type transporter [Streptomyces fradiae]PQM23069.1 MFS transporter [Streptomyces xinghaiensis]RKM91434.1 MFS transporter [Streptomyces xinghaiensis]RNC74929.1 MFS transporter [Streptomyces xinghaiensis]
MNRPAEQARPDAPAHAPATTGKPFHGWRIVAYSALAMAMTAPGQTAGISVFIDPLITGLGISRTEVSTAYLTGTLIGACAMPLVGRAIDRYGPRRVIAAVGAVFGAVLIGLSFVTGLTGLTAGFVGVRMTGQGALSLVATTTVAYWFDKRRGMALGITSAVGAAGISLAPVLVERLIHGYGWRQAWAIEGIAVWLVVLPLALFGIRNRPADLGQHVDGIPPAPGADTGGPPAGVPLRRALRTGMFWAVAAGLSASSMLTTGLNFHQIALLGERGLTPVEAAANFLPQTAAALLATLAAGALVDRLPPRAVLAGAMAVLAGAVLSARYVEPGWTAIGYGLLLGASGGLLRVIESAAYPRYFGTAHLGAIRGSAHTLTIAASAFGPLAVSMGHDLTGGYGTVLVVLTVIPAAAALTAVLAREPAVVSRAAG